MKVGISKLKEKGILDGDRKITWRNKKDSKKHFKGNKAMSARPICRELVWPN